MTHDEMCLRAGFYAMVAFQELGDDSYIHRYRGHAELITEISFTEMTTEISARLVAAGKLRPDEDPFETFFAKEP